MYARSFLSSLPEELQHGLLLGHQKSLGNEHLQITFTGSLCASVQIDVWVFCQSVFQQGSIYEKL